ncbi:sugar-binding transcriptional regulator [Streptomyces ochraceiscleroticus]|uniref:Sugar-binding transcriptional regulator n=1 Tax=Streptomyces ochraceiscleroticus TaxID=47761 RepID=A0ABW1MPY1_9ACTN|nr:sugar-binding transcriptional regulator [Streptomyces ochraceiscleroticus]
MSSREELRVMTRVARMYYTEGVRQPEIAARLDLSQAKVSRLLKKAQQQGIVRITVAPAPGTNPDLEDALQQQYGVKLALVVDTDPEDEKSLMADLGAAAAYYLETTLRSGDVVGLSSWSATLLETVDAMQPVPGLRDVRIVQAVGGVGDPAASGHASRLTGRLADLVRGEAVYLTAPGLAGSAESARALREDPFTASTLELLDHLTLALVGIGEVEPSSTLAQSGNAYSPDELKSLERQGAVGDVCLHFYDAHGAPMNSPLDDRVVGITTDQLRAVPRTVGIAGGRRKRDAIRGALRGGLIDVLITDHATARSLLDG